MATPRKRPASTGFNKEEKSPVVEEIIVEDIQSVDLKSKEEETFVPESIVPTEFVEVAPTPAPTPVVDAPKNTKPGLTLQPPPKRHPRNIPKFSSYR